MAQLTDLTVECISLVKRPANGRRIVLRGTCGAREFGLVKADARLHRVYGIVYAPGSVDAQGDWADAATIRQAADRWMLEGRARHVDQEHRFDPVPAYVAESWLVRPQDPLFPDEAEGAWAVGIQIEDMALWAAIEAGEVEGLSLAGTARLAKARPWYRNLFTRKEEETMTPDEVRAMVRQVLDETAQAAASEAQAAALAKSVEAARAEAQAIKEEAAAARALAEELARRVEALERAPLAKGAAEGDAVAQEDQESFV